MATRTHCPSCRHRLSPFAVECPVCGLSLARQALPRPLLFQASALQNRGVPPVRRQALAAPALGRISPVTVPEAPPPPAPELAPQPPPDPVAPVEQSYWPFARLELLEFLLLAGLNAALVLLVWLLLGLPPGRAYGALWALLLPVHAALSWTLFMVPLALTGQSPLMGGAGLLLEAGQPERRLAFSLFHLLSVLLFPVSFLCLVLTPQHRTLAELLTGQEILSRPTGRLR